VEVIGKNNRRPNSPVKCPNRGTADFSANICPVAESNF